MTDKDKKREKRPILDAITGSDGASATQQIVEDVEDILA
jgi:hypothetical protein